MSLAILTAVGDPRWESELTAGLSQPGSGVQVVRRCVDLADLLAAAAAGVARAAVLSADIRQLDRDAVNQLHDANVAVVGLVAAGDDAAGQRLHQLGIATVLPLGAAAATVAAAIHEAIATAHEAGPAAEPDAEPPPLVGEVAATTSGSGRVVAVWGPTGAPGRSTVTVNLAAELAALGHSVVLVDADSYGGVMGQLLGVLDDAPGVAAACRLANAGTFDVPGLAAVTLEIAPLLRLLTGITRPDRWLELRPAALAVVIEVARAVATYVVIDCGSLPRAEPGAVP